MSTISPHVLDTARSGPVAGVRVTLGSATPDGWWHVRSVVTNDGRGPDLLDPGENHRSRVHRLIFDTGAWFVDRDSP